MPNCLATSRALNPSRSACRILAKSSTVRILVPLRRHHRHTQGCGTGGLELDADCGLGLDADYQPKKNVATDYKTDCRTCHIPAKKNDWVYVRGYPLLKR